MESPVPAPVNDADPLAIAEWIQESLDLEPGLKKRQLAELLGDSWTPAKISHHLSLLRLPASVQEQVRYGSIPFGHARALARAARKHPPREVERLARLVTRAGWSVRRLEHHLRSGEATPEEDPDIKRVETQLNEQLQRPARLEMRPDGTGQLVLQFTTADFEDLVNRLGVKLE